MKLDSRAQGRFGVLAVLLLDELGPLCFGARDLMPPTLWNDDVSTFQSRRFLTRVGSIVPN